MSLRVKSIWGAAHRSPGLSGLLSRAPRPLCHRCASSATAARRDLSRLVPQAARATPARRLPLAIQARTGASSSPSAIRRSLLRRIAKRKARPEADGPESVLVLPLLGRGSKRERKRVRRKVQRSAARQALFAHAREERALETGSQRAPTWRGVLMRLSAATPRFGTMFSFRVLVAQPHVREGLSALSGVDTNIWQIHQKTTCIVRLETTDPATGSMVLSLSGSEHATRHALNLVVQEMGRVKAVRIMDQDSTELFRDVVKHRAASEHEKMRIVQQMLDVTVSDTNVALLLNPQGSPRYALDRRADEIVPPSRWTKISFLQYVSRLVKGDMPRHRRSVYQKDQKDRDHQHTVVRILVKLFASKGLAHAQSTAALAAAMSFIQAKGLTFRAEARTIFTHAEVNGVVPDTHTCNLLLQACSRLGDLDGFASITELMLRKQCVPNSATWLAFLQLVESKEAKLHILQRMRRRGLHRIESALVKVGSHMAPYDLGAGVDNTDQLMDFIKERDDTYTPAWLDTRALNRLVDALGGRERADLCEALLVLVHDTRRMQPNAVTLNTMLTHTRGMGPMISVLGSMRERWPSLEPDEGTFDILFRSAWLRRSPNMLHVIFRYASYAKKLTPKTMRGFDELLKPSTPRRKLAFLSEWKTEIFGEEVLEALRAKGLRSPSYAPVIAKAYGGQALNWTPVRKLDEMLAEAYPMDGKIHEALRRQKESQIQSGGEGEKPAQGEQGLARELRKSLTLSVPLQPTRQRVLPPETSDGATAEQTLPGYDGGGSAHEKTPAAAADEQVEWQEVDSLLFLRGEE